VPCGVQAVELTIADTRAVAMTFAIRADANTTIGHGQVMRCLTLAKALRGRGATVSFICREAEGHLLDLVESLGFGTHHLPERSGTSWQEDAAETSAAIGHGLRPDWLIVDHYELGAEWERAVRPQVGRIMVIDDLANRPHDCDLLLDQNLVAGMQGRYETRVPPTCGLLLGPEFALLQPEYEELHARVHPSVGPIQRVFVFFGGADVQNLTGMTMAALRKLKRPDIHVDVVLADRHPFGEGIRRDVAGDESVTVHSSLPTLAPLMAKADLAIGAGGSTSWERLCLGLPSLVITLADNQRPIADELQRRGLVVLLGDAESVDEAVIGKAVAARLEGPVDEGWSKRCWAAVDGRGVDRVWSALTVTSSTSLRVRDAQPADEALLLSWANDPSTRRVSFNPDPIAEAAHHAWFHQRVNDRDGCRLYIVEAENGVPLGSVRFQRHDLGWEVHYSLAQPYRGRGLGRPLLDAALSAASRELPQARIVGHVKPDNVASQRIFESLGFSARTEAPAGPIRYERQL
jgi:UDP-2,4-diacetamido-2,4,6-trideoxy-beta-L-altropyranose hydrolase